MAQDLLAACVRARCARTSTMGYGESEVVVVEVAAHCAATLHPPPNLGIILTVANSGHPSAMQRVLHG